MSREECSGLVIDPGLPARSLFHALSPRGLSTAFVEGLTRYVSRLASAHDVTVSDFICHEVFDSLFPTAAIPRDRRRSFVARCHLLDGSQAYTERWVNVLEAATCQTELRSTTLLPYVEICEGSVNRSVTPYRGAAEIRKALLTADARTEKSSISEVARELGYTGSDRLYQADRGLAHQLAEAHRKSGKSHWWKKPGARRICEVDQIRTVLEQTLALDEPRSLDHIAVDLGYSNDGYIEQKFPDLCRAVRKKRAKARLKRERTLSRVLKDALVEVPPPNLTDLRRRLGYSSSSVLRSHEPELCDRIMERHKRFQQQRIAELKTKAAAALSENPVPSLSEVIRRLQLSIWFIRKHFPELAKQIAERHRITAKADTQRQHRKAYEVVMRLAFEMSKEGIYPSIEEVYARLPKGVCREWRLLSEAVCSAQKTLGFDG
jgi:hypothetical protein